MASTSCLRRIVGAPSAFQSSFTAQRCILRLPQTSAFSTSSVVLAAPPKGKSGIGPPRRGEKSLRLKKSKSRKTDYKRPAPGERKALRKNIVLSNTNALEVPGLRELDAETLKDSTIEGTVLALGDTEVDSLRAVDAFKPRQGWYYFRRPATLMRKETMQLAKLFEEAGTPANRKTVRRVITGDRFTGKSTLLLQGMAVAFLKNWVVINIPDAMELVNGHTAYGPIEGSQPMQYIQPDYISNLLTQISKANTSVLSKTPLTKTYDLPIRPSGSSTAATTKKGSKDVQLTLADLADFGARNPEVSWAAFQALWTELTLPDRPPIFMGLDGLAYIMKEATYLTPELKKIHSHDLAIVNHFLSYLSGAKQLPNGGALMAATSKSNQPASAAMEYALQCAELRASGVPSDEIPEWDPYRTIDARAMESLRNVETLKVDGLSKDEARAVMEYYAASGMLRAVVDEKLVAEKWTMAGHGNIGELERGTVRSRV